MAEEKLNSLPFLRIRKLRIVLVLTGSYLICQVVGGLLTGSLALLADAGHMLTDVIGLSLSLLAVSFSTKPATPQKTYGFYRMEILASLANSLILVLIAVYITYEAYQRIINPPEVQGLPVLIIAAIGLVINIVGMKVLSHTHEHTFEPRKRNSHKTIENLNMTGAKMELLSDALGSIGVIIAGTIIYFTNFYLADPIISIGISLFILPRTWTLMKKSVHILMEGVPPNISHEEIKKALLNIRGVTGVFELHIWSITSGIDALSAHVVVIDTSRSREILNQINAVLENTFSINHSTIQIENYHEQKESV